jgi:hypothetical protein
MRIYRSLYCLLSACIIAKAAPDTAELIQDKPDRLYVDSDTLFTDSYTDNLTTDNEGAVSQGQLWHHDGYYWHDGAGGTGSRQDVQQSDASDSEGHHWGFTNRTASVMNWEADGSGTELYTANDGSTTTYLIGLPLLTSEHCLVNDPKSPPISTQDLGDGNWAINQAHEEYFRCAQTRWRLQTGGRGRRSSLFRFSATAAQILDKRAQRPFANVRSKPVPPQEIHVLGQTLRADTNLWLVLPDGTNLDVTPFVAGADFYRMHIVEQKYLALLTVNDVSLDAGTPEFCAGQYLTFKLEFDPPPELVGRVALWNLPGLAANESWRQSALGSVNYRFNSSLLTNLTTSCWYLNAEHLKASLGTVLYFANGQDCFLGVEGSLSIAKPSFSDFDNCSSLVGFVWNSPVLQANMQWGLMVQSAYNGTVGVTQLINGTNCCCTTGGEYRLDGNQEIYNPTSTNSPGQTYNADDPETHTVRFLSTRSCTASTAISLTATFKDYLRFKPAGGPNNIWVTLGTTSWSMDGAASVSGGLTRSNLPPANALVESDEFPFWTDQL